MNTNWVKCARCGKPASSFRWSDTGAAPAVTVQGFAQTDRPGEALCDEHNGFDLHGSCKAERATLRAALRRVVGDVQAESFIEGGCILCRADWNEPHDEACALADPAVRAAGESVA